MNSFSWRSMLKQSYSEWMNSRRHKSWFETLAVVRHQLPIELRGSSSLVENSQALSIPHFRRMVVVLRWKWSSRKNPESKKSVNQFFKYTYYRLH